MLEETGFDSENIVKVCSHYPNPALQSNQMHTYIAYDCKKVAEQNLDEFEDVSLSFCSIEQFENHLRSGAIDHSIMLASGFRALTLLKNKAINS